MPNAARTVRTLVPLAIAAALGAGSLPASAQDDLGEWTIYPPTGDIADIEIRGTTAWIGADGGVVQVDLATASSGTPNQRKIGVAQGLVDANVTALDIDGLGNAWVGTLTDGVSVFDAQGRHLTDLSSFEHLWSDLVIDVKALGNRVMVVMTDEYTAQGGLVGGGVSAVDVVSTPSGLRFDRVGLGISVDFAQVVLPETGVTWIGTRGRGLWRSDEALADAELVADQSTGLVQNNVSKLVRAPNPAQGGGSVLWIGTGAGMQTWDGATLTTVSAFQNRVILDLYHEGSTLLVLSEAAGLVRDLYQADLSQTSLNFQRIGRSECLPDTVLYVPREVARDAAGHICLGTRENGFTVREGFEWFCPPPLGPHYPQVSDLVIGADRALYFATGDKGPFNDGVGIGRFDGVANWSVISIDDGLVALDIHEVAAWPDTSMWFGSAISANSGGLNQYFPSTGIMLTYHDTVPFPDRVTQGKNARSLELDRFGNLWVVYGQEVGNGGGLSVIQPGDPPLVTNYPVSAFAPGGNELLRDIAFDSRDRLWVTTFSDANRIGLLYVIDPRGTLANTSDDGLADQFNVANEITELGPIDNIEIDPLDQIWLAGQLGLVVGQIGSDVGGRPGVEWDILNPGVEQTGGRNPVPYTAAKLADDNSIWLGTDASGVVNVSKDTREWKWYDQEAGSPLPDQAIRGLYLEPGTDNLWIGMATGGIAKVDLTGGSNGEVEKIEMAAFPNPWRPNQNAVLALGAIPEEETITLRIYDVSGDLVYEETELRGEKTWDGKNQGAQLVESGTYLMKATSTNGKTYQGKVAVVR